MAALGQSPARTHPVNAADATAIDMSAADVVSADMAAVRDPEHVAWTTLPREKVPIVRRLWFLLQCALHLLARLVAGA
jgi:hypothetical protein